MLERGYFSEGEDIEKCRLWLPDFRNSVDLYNPGNKIAIEIEKTEKKRVVKMIENSKTRNEQREEAILQVLRAATSSAAVTMEGIYRSATASRIPSNTAMLLGNAPRIPMASLRSRNGALATNQSPLSRNYRAMDPGGGGGPMNSELEEGEVPPNEVPNVYKRRGNKSRKTRKNRMNSR